MDDREQLETAGRQAAVALRVQEEWIHRRVESVTFPSPAEPVYQRHISIDFTIPQGILGVPFGDEECERFYVPLSVLRKWPPLLRLDLRDSSGTPIPLLTGAQNEVIDTAALTELAREVVEPTATLTEDIKADIRQLVGGLGPAETNSALRSILPRVPLASELDEARKLLRKDPLFVALASGLRENTFLWLRVEARRGCREIVKFAYDIPMEVKSGSWSLASFGLRAFTADFPSPHIGTSSSYHLTISAPPPLRVVDTEVLIVREPSPDEKAEAEEEIVAKCTAEPGLNEVKDLLVYTEVVGDQGRYYVAGQRPGCLGKARISIIPDRGFVQSAWFAAVAIAILLSGYKEYLHDVLEVNDAAVSLALVAPALLAYLLIRPAQHAFARSFAVGVRRLLLLSGLLPIVGAAGIVVSGARQTTALEELFSGLAVAGWVVALALLVALVALRGKRLYPLSRG